ncbi:hypothetical protein [Endozoicomonas sp. ONNA1]|uniref:hypothetical protein n=1 Tax=unclassified Endozoicomonas TaxID=2644528 RepID=UPI0034D2948F
MGHRNTVGHNSGCQDVGRRNTGCDNIRYRDGYRSKRCNRKTSGRSSQRTTGSH